jgi:hypothetical protein
MTKMTLNRDKWGGSICIYFQSLVLFYEVKEFDWSNIQAAVEMALAFFLGLSNSAVEPKYSLTHGLLLDGPCFGPTGVCHSMLSESSGSEPSSKILPVSP